MRKRTAKALVLLVAVALAYLGIFTNHSYITTPSMYPTIPPGSVIFVSPATQYHVGEVIEFRANGLIWAHRLVEITSTGDFITKGDNPMNARDVFVPSVTQKDVIGVVTHSVRWIGFPQLIAHQPGYGLSWLRAELGFRGKIAFVGGIALVSLISAAVPGARLRRRRSEQKFAERRSSFSRDQQGSEDEQGFEPDGPTSRRTALVGDRGIHLRHTSGRRMYRRRRQARDEVSDTGSQRSRTG